MNKHLPDNSLGALVRHFKKSLSDIYEPRELNQITAIVIEDRLGFSRTDLVVKSEQKLSESDILSVHFVLKKLKIGKPMQYALGKSLFLDMELAVTQDVLIPRPETEELVRWISDDNQQKKPVILDVGTGSGCIALGLKKMISKSKVYAMDISQEALKIAEKNSLQNNLPIEFVHQSALESVSIGHPLDIVVSNPPYISLDEKDSMPKLVTDNEPSLALFVENKDPLLFYRAIAKKAFEELKQGGSLYFELHERNGKATEQLLKECGFAEVEIKMDFQGKPRMIKSVKPFSS